MDISDLWREKIGAERKPFDFFAPKQKQNYRNYLLIAIAMSKGCY